MDAHVEQVRGSMDISFMSGEQNMGREDRLVRACVALSLFLLGAFGVLASQSVGIIALVFVLLGSYFALTAGAAWDPVYSRAGIDTRTDAELADGPVTDLSHSGGPGQQGASAGSPDAVSVQDGAPIEAGGAPQEWVSSVLGR